MRRRSSIDSLFDQSEYAGSDVDDGAESDNTDLTDAGLYSDEDKKPCEGTEDEVWLPHDEPILLSTTTNS